MTRRGLLTAGGLAGAAMAGILLAIAIAPAGQPADDIGGVRPGYGPAAVAAVPNGAAIVRRFWAPGLDAGYNPQGLAVADGAVVVSAYHSDGFDVRRGPCRVFRLDPRSGRETGQVDVPAPCGHAGGLAVAGDGRLYVADTHTLFSVARFSVAPSAAFAGEPPRVRRLPLGIGLIGALAASAAGAIWLGTYQENAPGRLFRFDGAVLAAMPDGDMLTVAHASAQITIPSYAQGAAIDRDGWLWVARSDTRWGEVDRLDPATGAVGRRYPVAPGIEGIVFDADGLLWAVSEAGARHSYDNFFAPLFAPFFPLVFALDPRRLAAEE